RYWSTRRLRCQFFGVPRRGRLRSPPPGGRGDTRCRRRRPSRSLARALDRRTRMTALRPRAALILLVLVQAAATIEAASVPVAGVARGVIAPGDEKLDGRLRGLLTPGAPVGTAKLVPQPLPALRGSDVHVFVAVDSVGQDDVAALGRAGLTVERVNAEQ